MKITVRIRDRIEFSILGQELCRLRKAAGLSQAKVEASLNQHSGWSSRIEKGSYYIDFATMLDYIALTGGNAPDVIKRVQEEAALHYKSLGQKPPFER